MKTIHAPEADMLLVSKSSRNQRKSILNFAPKIGLSVVDYGRLDEIDTFYQECQNFRDYYRDPYNKLHRPLEFQKHHGKCGIKVRDKNTELLMLPVTWVRENVPVVYHIDYDRDVHLDEGIKLGGFYDLASCIKYKR